MIINSIAIIVLSIGMIMLAKTFRKFIKTSINIFNLILERFNISGERIDVANRRLGLQDSKISAIAEYLDAHFEEKKEIVINREHWYSDDTETIKTTTVLVKNKVAKEKKK